ncbi:MAG: GNAT family N-acetyltransferase [Bacteroidetes bacterium]|nr:GNAT family N-acetyltransferase [Bacteroidota bacterium]
MNINSKAADHEEINEIIEMMNIFYQHEQLEFNHEKNLKIVHELLNNSDLGKIWLIQSNNETAGYLILTYGFSVEYGGRFALIDEFYIKQEFRNKGIGTETLKFVEENCKANGVETIHLQVKNFNSSAKKLYAALGYEEIDRIFMRKCI